MWSDTAFRFTCRVSSILYHDLIFCVFRQCGGGSSVVLVVLVVVADIDFVGIDHEEKRKGKWKETHIYYGGDGSGKDRDESMSNFCL